MTEHNNSSNIEQRVDENIVVSEDNNVEEGKEIHSVGVVSENTLEAGVQDVGIPEDSLKESDGVQDNILLNIDKENSNYKYCLNCGNKVDKSVNYCPVCRYDFVRGIYPVKVSDKKKYSGSFIACIVGLSVVWFIFMVIICAICSMPTEMEDNALDKAESYVEYMNDLNVGVTEKDVRDNLILAGFNDSEIDYAVSEIDFDDQADIMVKGYVESINKIGLGVSRKDLEEYLVEEGFDVSDFKGSIFRIDFNDQAVMTAKYFVEGESFSFDTLVYMLREVGFEKDEAEYAADYCKAFLK